MLFHCSRQQSLTSLLALCKDVAHMPGIVADWISALAKHIKIRASADAPLLKPPKHTSGYPIIIFSHGLGMIINDLKRQSLSHMYI